MSFSPAGIANSASSSYPLAGFEELRGHFEAEKTEEEMKGREWKRQGRKGTEETVENVRERNI